MRPKLLASFATAEYNIDDVLVLAANLSEYPQTFSMLAGLAILCWRSLALLAIWREVLDVMAPLEAGFSR